MTAALLSRQMFAFDVTVSAPIVFGDTGLGVRRCIPITGGTFTGDLEGRILPGADWQTVQASDILEISAHYALQTNDGAVIEVFSDGVRVAGADVLARIARGETVDPAEYYFRTAMRFRTSVPAPAKLNSKLAISIGERR
jgi:hypothetical protein